MAELARPTVLIKVVATQLNTGFVDPFSGTLFFSRRDANNSLLIVIRSRRQMSTRLFVTAQCVRTRVYVYNRNLRLLLDRTPTAKRLACGCSGPSFTGPPQPLLLSLSG